ncbi:tetratricopeptide repeat protein [Candidatus Poribacteria bacterium]
MERTAVVDVRISIDEVEGKKNTYRCVMNVDGYGAAVEEVVEFPIGSVELLQPMYALEDHGLLTKYVDLPGLGQQLYDLLFHAGLGEQFEQVLEKSRVGERIRVILDTHHGEILSLPWELIMHPTRGYLCREGSVSLIRTLGKEFRQAEHVLEAPPLRILMVVASPDDAPKLDFEKEQEVLQAALEPLVRKGLVEVEYSEDGTLAGLKREIESGRYHILHLSGHGGLSGKKGFFAFENDEYKTDPVKADRLLDVLKGADSVKYVLLGGCVTSKTDQAALAGMAQTLCDGGVPLVMGFQLSVLDIAATHLMGQLYSRISDGWDLDRALTDGRVEVQHPISENEALADDVSAQVSWSIPTLYASSSLQRIVDFDMEPVKNVEPQIDFSARFGDIQYLSTGFVGRRRNIRQCREILRESPCLYIHGFGGIGKSTLATKLSERFAHDGCCGLFLKGGVRVEAIVSQVAQDLLNEDNVEGWRTLNSADVPSDAKLQYCIDKVFAQTPYIIILDNFEDNQTDDLAIDKSLETGLAALLKGIAPTPTRVIITSRYELNSQSLRPYIGQHNLGEMSLSDAVKKMNRYDSLVVQSPEIKRRIYDRLGGHPKAIEDVAAALGTEAVQWEHLEEKLEGIEDALQVDFLLLEVLYDFLKPQERELLRRASVYTQSVSYNGLQKQVKYDIEDMISPLVERSLLQRGRDEKGEEVYYVHRITAQFLKDLISDSEHKESHQRATEHYDYEIENNHMNSWNFLTARQHYLACGDLERAVEIVALFVDDLRIRGNYELAMKLHQETLGNAPDERIKAVALHNIGVIHQNQGRYDDALKYYSDSLRIQQQLGNQDSIAASLHNIGVIHQDQGRYDDALKYYSDSLRIQQESGNQDGIAASLHSIGVIHQDQGRYDDALKYYNDSLRIKQESGNQAGIANSLHSIGIIHHRQGKYEDALKHYNDSLRIQQQLEDQAGIANSLNSIGLIHQDQGRYEDALKYHNDSLHIKQELEDQAGIANSLNNVGIIHQLQSRYEDALKYYNDSLRIRRELDSQAGIAESLHNIGIIHQLQSRYEDALKYYNDSLRIEQELGNQAGIAESLHNIGMIHQNQRRYEDALKYILRSLIIFRALNSPNAQIASDNLSNIRQQMGEVEFEKSVQAEMREIEQKGPFVVDN